MNTRLIGVIVSFVLIASCSSKGADDNGGDGGAGGDTAGGNGGDGGASNGGKGGGGATGGNAGGNGGASVGGAGDVGGTNAGGANVGGGGVSGTAGAAGGTGGAVNVGGTGGVMNTAGAGGNAAVTTGCGSATDTATYNFETDIQGWGYPRHPLASRPAPVVSTAQHCNGKSSLEYTINIAGNEAGEASNYILGRGNMPFEAGKMKMAKRVVFHVWVPATPEINFQPFIGGNAQVTGPNSYAVPGGINRGGWTRFAVDTATLPAGDESQIWLGLFTTAAFSGKVYIDSVGLEN